MSIFRRIVVAAFAVSLASLFHPAAFAANQPGGQLGSLVCQRDFRSEGRGLDALGLADLEVNQLMRLVTGESLHR